MDIGYPLEGNAICPVPEPRNDFSFLSPDLADCESLRIFYCLCNGIDLPDLSNGVFIHRAELIEINAIRNVPIRLRRGGPILVFGSDGGGGMFAVSTGSDSSIIHLPTGTVFDGEFDNVRFPEKHISSDFVEFLSRISDDIDAFITRRHGWKFIA